MCWSSWHSNIAWVLSVTKIPNLPYGILDMELAKKRKRCAPPLATYAFSCLTQPKCIIWVLSAISLLYLEFIKTSNYSFILLQDNIFPYLKHKRIDIESNSISNVFICTFVVESMHDFLKCATRIPIVFN
jgi:hypothetical protein